MNTKHTPGPWRTDCDEHDQPYQNIKIKRGNRTVATVWIDDAPVHDYNREQEANARLIASAPDLLEALEALLSPEASRFERISDIHDFARAAIAKAHSTNEMENPA